MRAGSVLVFIPCLGDYLTPDLLGGGRTILIGNLIQNQFTAARDYPVRRGRLAGADERGDAAALAVAQTRGKRIPMSRLLSLYVAAAYAFLYLPLVVLSVFSFNDSRFSLWNGLSTRWYRAAWENPQLTHAATTSLLIAACSTLFATVAGTLCAYGLWKRNSRRLTPCSIPRW